MHPTHTTEARVYSRREAAAMLGITPTTLSLWAAQGRGPVYSRSGDRRGRVWYCGPEIERWLQSRSIEPGGTIPSGTHTPSPGGERPSAPKPVENQMPLSVEARGYRPIADWHPRSRSRVPPPPLS